MSRSSAGSRPRLVRRFGPVLLLALALVAGVIGLIGWLDRPSTAPGRRDRNPSLTWRSIEAAAARGDRAVVERGLNDWLAQHPNDGKALVVLAGLRHQDGREAESRALLGRVATEDPAFAGALAMRGDLALQRGDLDEVERVDRMLMERDPNAIQPRKRRIFLMSLELRNAEARAALWDLYRIQPSPEALADLVSALFQVEHDVRGHGPELARFLALTPNDPWLRRADGLGLHWRGRSAEALPQLEAAAAQFERDPIGRFALEECRRTLGIGDSGDPVEVVLGQPTSDGLIDRAAWNVLAGRIDEARGSMAEAVKHYQQATQDNPNDREAHFRLAEVLSRSGRSVEARPHREQAEAIQKRERALTRALADARRDGFSPETCEKLGNLCAEVQLRAEARAWFDLASQADSERQAARAALDRLGPPQGSEIAPLALARPVLRSSPGVAVAQARPRPVETSEPMPSFEDVAARWGIDLRYECGERGDLFIVDTMGGGVGLIDADGDGWLDLYLVNGCRLPVDAKAPPAPNRLLRNNGDGTFTDVTARAGVGGRGYGMGCAVGDYDGDGRDDLFVTGYGQTLLYRNRGDGTFEDVTARARVGLSAWSTAAGFGDLDGDGDLDLVVVTYVEADPSRSPECRDNAGHPIHCSPGYFTAQPDHLFRNNGDGTFTDVSHEAGIDLPGGRGLGLAVADLDEDGKLDLFVANDASPNFYFRNLGGLKFEELAMSAGLGCDGSGKATASMGVVAADLNRDGRLDLFHTNFLNEPNTLRLNLGEGQFRDATLGAGLDAPSRASTGFGTVAIDTLNRGRLDLFVANGHVDDQPWVNSPMAQLPHLYLARDPGHFRLAASSLAPYFGRPVVGRGVASGDLDHDGRVDLVVVHRDAPVAVLRNTSPAGHWLSLDLRGTRSGSTPVGARVTAVVAGRASHHWVSGGLSYLSASDRRIHLGLGTARVVERIEVRWPSGLVQTFENVGVDRILRLEEGGSLQELPRAPEKPAS
ncbi:MAG: FG-GAP-like repeat-containing protein [Isosphaeraceae bacterium]